MLSVYFYIHLSIFIVCAGGWGRIPEWAPAPAPSLSHIQSENRQKFSFPWVWNMEFLTIRDSQTF